jgi:hypothetical protein
LDAAHSLQPKRQSALSYSQENVRKMTVTVGMTDEHTVRKGTQEIRVNFITILLGVQGVSRKTILKWVLETSVVKLITPLSWLSPSLSFLLRPVIHRFPLRLSLIIFFLSFLIY